jgi:hypothetical protein
MSAYLKAHELGLTGTDAEIVAVLQVLTVSDIPVKSVRTWFRENNLWLERSTGGMMGPLQDAYQAASQQAKDGLDYLYDTVFTKSADYLRTTTPVWAVKVKELVDLVVALSPQTSGLVESFYSLDGGRPLKDLTVEQFAESRIAHEAAQDQAALDAQWSGLQNDGNINTAVAANNPALLATSLETAAAAIRQRWGI